MNATLLSYVTLTCICLAPAGGRATADTIRLEPAVTITADATAIRLADVAHLEGADALGYADLVLVDLAALSTPPTTLTVQQVRAALDEAGAHWGRINLKGNRTTLRTTRRGAAPPVAMQGAALAGTARRPTADERGPVEDDHVARSIIDADTLRGAIARDMTHALDVSPDDLRLIFAVSDRERLDAPTAGRAFEITPLDRRTSDRVAMSVRSWHQQRIVDDVKITVRPLHQVRVPVLRRDVARDMIIQAGDYGTEARWITFAHAGQVCRPDDAAGCAAARAIRAGDVIRRQEVRAPTLVERGDRVIVRYLHGGLVISLTAEARDDGAEGEVIRLRKLGERATQTFLATVVARGEAVVDRARAGAPATPSENDSTTGASHDS